LPDRGSAPVAKSEIGRNLPPRSRLPKVTSSAAT
jgi:hypothetical protein